MAFMADSRIRFSSGALIVFELSALYALSLVLLFFLGVVSVTTYTTLIIAGMVVGSIVLFIVSWTTYGGMLIEDIFGASAAVFPAVVLVVALVMLVLPMFVHRA